MDRSQVERNRSQLQLIFARHTKTSKMSVAELEKDKIGQGSFRLLLTRGLKLSSTTRSAISFSQFEEVLRQVAQYAFPGSSEAKKLQSLFSYISEPAKAVYKTQIERGRSKRRYSSSRSTVSNNDSLELDQNIKEALETLKTRGSNPRTPKSRVLFPEEKNSKEPAGSKTDELQEFLEIEKSVQNEIKQVTVKLVPKSPLRTQSYKDSAPKKHEISRLTTPKVSIPKKNQDEKLRDFVVNTRKASFSKQIVLRLVFASWRNAVKFRLLIN